MDQREAVALIQDALARTGTNRPDGELHRLADSIYVQGVLRKAERLARSRCGTDAARRQLVSIDRKILKLAEALDGLAPDAVLALGPDRQEIGPALERLRDLQIAVADAHGRLSGENIPARRGAKGDSAALEITRYVAGLYRDLTGRKPDRLGERTARRERGFDALLTSVFTALEIEGTPDHFIRRIQRGAKAEK